VKPNSLRSWGGSWAGIDEEKDIPDTAIDIVWGCLRLTEEPQIFGAGTPEMGMYQARYDAMLDDPDSEVFSFPSRDNPFISHKVFDIMKGQMDERRYRQEVLAEFINLEESPLVCHGFNTDKHTITLPTTRNDITALVTKKRFGRPYEYVVGVDYNWNYPNYAVMYKIYKNPVKGQPNIWIAEDLLVSKGNASHLAKFISSCGYDKRKIVVIDDATGRFNKGPKSSSRLMRAAGIAVKHPNVNPPVVDRINAFLAKLSPIEGDPTWLIGLPQCDELVDCCENLMYNDSGRVDKSSGYDHIFDAATYPIVYLEPAAKWKIPTVKGIINK
jgi:hypothetical protein